MASCKDCLHVEVCREYVMGLAAVRGVELNEAEIEQVLVSDGCDNFKDRFRFVELPCRVNLCDEVHFILRGLDEIDLKEYLFTVGNSAVSDTVQFVTEIGTYGFWVGDLPREFAPDYDEFYHWYELGETVFLSREAAEQFLKEREKDE